MRSYRRRPHARSFPGSLYGMFLPSAVVVLTKDVRPAKPGRDVPGDRGSAILGVHEQARRAIAHMAFAWRTYGGTMLSGVICCGDADSFRLSDRRLLRSARKEFESPQSYSGALSRSSGTPSSPCPPSSGGPDQVPRHRTAPSPRPSSVWYARPTLADGGIRGTGLPARSALAQALFAAMPSLAQGPILGRARALASRLPAPVGHMPRSTSRRSARIVMRPAHTAASPPSADAVRSSTFPGSLYGCVACSLRSSAGTAGSRVVLTKDVRPAKPGRRL